jgi:DNA-binding MarR family transcriptional regulator
MFDGSTRLLRSVQRLGTAFGRLERMAASAHDVTVAQLRVLAALDERNATGATVGELAEDQGVAISTMTRNLIVLERLGYARRAPDGIDRRAVRVQLTDIGRQQARLLKESTLVRLGQAFSTFHPTDRIERAVALDRVAAALERVRQ